MALITIEGVDVLIVTDQCWIFLLAVC